LLRSLEDGCWSPDGKRLFCLLTDARDVHHVPITDYSGAEETVSRSPYVKSGGTFGRFELTVYQPAAGEKYSVDIGGEGDAYIFMIGWREGGEELLFLRLSRDSKQLSLLAWDVESRTTRTILTDTQETFVGGLDFIVGGWKDYFTAIEGDGSFLWISERTGWRQVFLYDYQGQVISRVTEGDFSVGRVVDVDVERERVFMMANAEEGPYDTHLYRAPLAGGELVRLTEGAGEHKVQISPSKLWFVDTHSSLTRPTISELRNVEGERVTVLAELDTSAIDARGWVPVEPFVVKADDGVTDLHGVLYKPIDFDPERSYPVIDFIYTGPFIAVVPNEFGQNSPWAIHAHAMAQMGFITFVVDPRGTIERGKAFQDASFGRIGEIEIPDHVATLHQLAAERPYMDLERVGIRGHSWGGYFALRAMLTAPDVFHAGVAGAPGDLTEAAPINEPYMGLPADNPGGYRRGSNPAIASHLQGELLLIHGTADINAPICTTMRMVEALIAADKDFDLIVVPGADHGIRGPQGDYVSRRIRDFFLEHLAP